MTASPRSSVDAPHQNEFHPAVTHRARSLLADLVQPSTDSVDQRRRNGHLLLASFAVASSYNVIILGSLPHTRLVITLTVLLVSLTAVTGVLPWSRISPRLVIHLFSAVFAMMAVLHTLAGDVAFFAPIFALGFTLLGLIGSGTTAITATLAVTVVSVAGVLATADQAAYAAQASAMIVVSAFTGLLTGTAIDVNRRHQATLEHLQHGLTKLLTHDSADRISMVVNDLARDLLEADVVRVLTRTEPGGLILADTQTPGTADSRESGPVPRSRVSTELLGGEDLGKRGCPIPSVFDLSRESGQIGVTFRRGEDSYTAEPALRSASGQANDAQGSALYMAIGGDGPARLGVLVAWWSSGRRPKPFQRQMAQLLLTQVTPILTRAQALHLLTTEARHDALTGVANRRAFEEALTGMPPRATLILMDLDRFKQVNDSLGHPVGDQVLREFAATVNTCIRSSDFVARIGGDEFAVLIDGDLSVARMMTQRLDERWKRPHGVGFSIGMSTRRAADDEAELIARTDSDLYRAKRARASTTG